MIEAIEKRVEFDATPERVWKALTDGEELARWFPEEADGMGPAAEGAFFWKSHGHFAFRVEAFEPPSFLAWRWVGEPDADIDDAASTLVEFRLSRREDGGTVLELRESGFAHEKKRRENEGGWDHELAELAALLAA